MKTQDENIESVIREWNNVTLYHYLQMVVKISVQRPLTFRPTHFIQVRFTDDLGPLLLTWFNFNPSMDE